MAYKFNKFHEDEGIDESAIDHGSISGLTDDDHTIYVKHDGSRATAITLPNIANPIIQQYDDAAWGTTTKKLKVQSGFDGTSQVGMTVDVKGEDTTVADSYTKLLLHANGTDTSTTFTDTGVTGHTVTANGNAQIDTTVKKFGSGSAQFDGTGDYLSIPASADFSYGSGDFTVDFWFYTSSTSRQYFFGPGTDTTTHYYGVGLDYNSIGTNKLGLWASTSGTTWNLINADPGGNGIGSTTLPQNQWNHIALARYGNSWTVYLNGVSDISVTAPGTLRDASGVQFNIGRTAYLGGTFWVNGYIDEFRVSKGIARWTTGFSGSLPSVEYDDKGATVRATLDIINSASSNFVDAKLQGDYYSDNLILSKTSGYGIKVDKTTPTFGWFDMLGDVIIRSPGANDPTWATYRGNIKQFSFSNVATNEAFVNFHIQHNYTPGTDIYLHFHWSQIVVDSGGAAGAPGVVKWQADVTYAKGHNQDVFIAPVTTSITQTASSTQYRHMIAEVQLSASSPSATQIDSDNLEPDGVIMVRIFRDPTDAADTLNQVPFLHYIDIHYQSTGIPTKQKAPNFYV